MSKLRAVFFVVCALAIIGFGVASYWLYDHKHMSSDLRRTLTAAVDPNSSEADVRTYLRDARTQIHTKHDASEVQTFEQAVIDAQISMDAKSRNDERFRKLISSVGEKSHAEDLMDIEQEYVRNRMQVPQSLRDEVHQAIIDQKVQREQDQANDDADTKLSENKQKEAIRLFQQVRSDLGLPLLKEQ